MLAKKGRGIMDEENFDNLSNSSNCSSAIIIDDLCIESTIYRKVMGTVIFVAVWPFIVLDFKFFPLGRPAASLLGAALMVLFAVVPQEQVFYILGQEGNLQTLFLLIGMMLLSYYYNREGILCYVTLWIFGKNKPLSRILWKVCVLSAVLSAIITNDATCLVLTPLILEEHRKQKRSKSEYPPLLLGIATSSNIGGAATFFGNPQNAFIAANSRGNISLLIFFATTLPAAIVGMVISILVLYLCYFRTVGCSSNSTGESDRAPEVNYNTTQIQVENSKDAADDIVDYVDEATQQETSRKSCVTNWRKKVFVVWLVVATAIVLILLALPPPPTVSVEFNLGLVPMGAGIFTMLVDALLNRNYARKAMMEVDWTIILLFMGLFVWLAGFENTLFPSNAFDFIQRYMHLNRIQGVLLFTVFMAVGSNILSNVPLVILVIHQLFSFMCGESVCSGQLTGMLLAWVSTIAGNFTLIGSIANLIVAEKGRTIVNYRLGFFEYLKFGLVSTTLVLFAGLPVVYFASKHVNI